MGIKIHHGPDGTYKTSGAIKEDILPVIKNGRTLVTNVRGFSREKAVKVLGRKMVHKNFNVIFVDTEGKDGRDKMARFFHWAPNGAFFVIDEVQRIFKPDWGKKELALLDYPGGDIAAEKDNKPENIHTAWDMQRHYNWDFVFTTTSIKKVRAEMCDMAKIAIRHYNIGVWRFYKTVEHSSDNKGTTQSAQGTIKVFNYVPSKIFALYSSTKTDSFTNSEPRTPFYRDPKILGILISLAVFWTYLLNKPVPVALGGSGSDTPQNVKQSDQVSTNKNNSSVVSQGSNSAGSVASVNDVNNKQYHQSSAIEPFIESSSITGLIQTFNYRLNSETGKYDRFSTSIYTFESNFNGQDLSFSSLDLIDRGYSVSWVNDCVAEVSRSESTRFIHCGISNFIKPIINNNDDNFNNEPVLAQAY
jgi:zona occludens toxin